MRPDDAALLDFLLSPGIIIKDGNNVLWTREDVRKAMWSKRRRTGP